MPDTRSGRVDASTLARPPPRLWPTIAAAAALLRDQLLQPDLELLHEPRPSSSRWPASRPCWGGARCGAASWPSAQASRRPARKPGIRSTGWPRPSSTPSPRKTGCAQKGRRLEADPRFPPERRSGATSDWSPSSHREIHNNPEVGQLPLPPTGCAKCGYSDEAHRVDCAARACRDHPGWAPGRRGAPRSRAGQGRAARAGAGGGPQRGRHAPAKGRLPGAARRRRRTFPAWSWPARWRRWGRARPASAEGDRVMAIVGGGGQAELALLHERAAMPVPEALDWPAAGGAPEVFITAHDALFTQAQPPPRRAPARARRRRRGGHGGDAARPRRPGRAWWPRSAARSCARRWRSSAPRRWPRTPSRSTGPSTSSSSWWAPPTSRRTWAPWPRAAGSR